jgi:Xaa-Pro aminopeptidase
MSTARVETIQDMLGHQGFSALVATPGADLAYLAGNWAHPSERPQILIIPVNGRPLMVCSSFESLALPPMTGIDLVTYGETDDVYDLIRRSTVEQWWTNALISDVARADVVLGLQDALVNSCLSPASPLIRELRMVKDREEAASLREAARRADSAFGAFASTQFTGNTEQELSQRLKRIMEAEGLQGPSSIVAAGPNGASPHHHSSDRQVIAGDMVVIDFFGTFDGYWADTTRTVAVASASQRQREIHDVVRGANAAACAAVRPGVSADSIDAAARMVITDAGHGDAFIHRTGHGIGLDEHEEPYMVAGNMLALEAGMTFTIEPGIYLAGEFGVRIEDVVIVTDDGVDVLNSMPRELNVVV